jgi:hypothetical protein
VKGWGGEERGGGGVREGMGEGGRNAQTLYAHMNKNNVNYSTAANTCFFLTVIHLKFFSI